jgi:hypothetical protein
MGALRRAKIDEKDRFLGIQADGAAATDIKPSEITVSGGAHFPHRETMPEIREGTSASP